MAQPFEPYRKDPDQAPPTSSVRTLWGPLTAPLDALRGVNDLLIRRSRIPVKTAPPAPPKAVPAAPRPVLATPPPKAPPKPVVPAARVLPRVAGTAPAAQRPAVRPLPRAAQRPTAPVAPTPPPAKPGVLTPLPVTSQDPAFSDATAAELGRLPVGAQVSRRGSEGASLLEVPAREGNFTPEEAGYLDALAAEQDAAAAAQAARFQPLPVTPGVKTNQVRTLAQQGLDDVLFQGLKPLAGDPSKTYTLAAPGTPAIPAEVRALMGLAFPQVALTGSPATPENILQYDNALAETQAGPVRLPVAPRDEETGKWWKGAQSALRSGWDAVTSTLNAAQAPSERLGGVRPLSYILSGLATLGRGAEAGQAVFKANEDTANAPALRASQLASEATNRTLGAAQAGNLMANAEKTRAETAEMPQRLAMAQEQVQIAWQNARTDAQRNDIALRELGQRRLEHSDDLQIAKYNAITGRLQTMAKDKDTAPALEGINRDWGTASTEDVLASGNVLRRKGIYQELIPGVQKDVQQLVAGGLLMIPGENGKMRPATAEDYNTFSTYEAGGRTGKNFTAAQLLISRALATAVDRQVLREAATLMGGKPPRPSANVLPLPQ